jgi:hypothetical protein
LEELRQGVKFGEALFVERFPEFYNQRLLITIEEISKPISKSTKSNPRILKAIEIAPKNKFAYNDLVFSEVAVISTKVP